MKIITIKIGLINRWLVSLILIISLYTTDAFTQTTTLTTSPNPPYNGSTTGSVNTSITFVLENTNVFPIELKDVSTYLLTGEVGTFQLWYSSTSLGGQPTVASPVWTMISQVNNSAPTSTGINPVFTSLGFYIPPATQYRFALSYVTTNCRYSGSSPISPNTFTGGGVNMKLGDVVIGGGNVGYSGTNTPRYFTGSISFAPGSVCVSPPLSGTIASSANPVCPNANFTLSITGGTNGLGQTYQWQSSSDNVTYTNISGATNRYFTTWQLSDTYYRCETTCGTGTVQSTGLQVISNLTPLSGVYTLNNTLPLSATNYQTWVALAWDLSCRGISAPVTINVNPAIYTEQVSLGAIPGSSSVNTVTFNGNGSTLTYGATLAGAPHTLDLNGTDYTNWFNMNITGTGSMFALACHLWNQSDNNNFNNCTFNCNANINSIVAFPFSISGSATSGINTGISGNNNILTGCTMFSGYHSISIVGSSTSPSTGNQIINCNLRDFQYTGSYNRYSNGTIIRGCTIERPTRTSLNNYFRGVELFTGCSDFLVEKNRIRHPFASSSASTQLSYGIYSSAPATAGPENKFYNNVISDFNSNGAVYGIYINGANNTKIYHNTVSFDYAAATGTETHYGIYTGSAATGWDIKNNIVTITQGGTGIKYGLYFDTSTGILCNNNIIYVAGAGGTNNHGYWGGSAFGTFAAWKTANSGTWDQNSLSANPLYLASGLGDFTPTNGTVNNIGANIGITTDIVGTARTLASPDPGAFEFTATVAPIDIGVTALVVPATGGNCYTNAQTVTATIRNFGSTIHNFSANPSTITCKVTGASTATITFSPTGTLAAGASTNITFSSTLNLSALGTHNLRLYSGTTGDTNLNNDSLASVAIVNSLTAGTISTPVITYCGSGSPVLTLSGNTSGTTIQWQSSTTSTSGPWTNVGTNSSTYTPNVTQTSYFRAVVSCGANTSNSNTTTININAPTAGTISTPTITYCGSGSPVLTLSGNTSGSTIQWQVSTASVSGPWTNVGTNSSTYTATVTQTSYFRAVVSCSGSPSNSNVITINLSSVVAGTITSPSTSYCTSGTPVLTLSGNTNGTSIQWQSSTTSTSGPWTNVGANSNTYSPTITQTTHFRTMVSCNNNFAFAIPITISINSTSPPIYINVNSTNSCSPVSLTLSLTTHPIGSTIQWQESFTGSSGPWGNTGTNSANHTTSITDATYFRAIVTCNSNVQTTNALFTYPLNFSMPGLTITSYSTANSAGLYWSPVSGISNYAYRYRILNSATWSMGTTTSITATLSGLIPGTYYEWQVQSFCLDGGVSPFTSSVVFSTSPNCAAAQAIAGNTFYTFNPPTGHGAWQSYNVACTSSTFWGMEKVYTFTPTVSGTHVLLVQPVSSTTNLPLFNYKAASLGCDISNWNCIGNVIANSGANQYAFGPLTAGTQYYILCDYIDGFATPVPVTFRIESPSCSPRPVNVTTPSITNSSMNVNWTGSGTSGTLFEYGAPNFIPGTGSTAGTGGTVVLFTGTSGTITGLTAGTTYDIYARNYCGNSFYSPNSDRISASTQQGCAATITGSATFCAGASNILTANTGTGISYQWYRNTVLQTGATSNTYNANSSGTYYVVETSTCGTAQSNSIIVSQINNPNPTVSYSTPLSFCPPGNVVLTSSTFSGVSYQWQKNSADIAGATLQNYTATTNGTYRVRQTANGCFKYAPAVTVATATSVTAAITANGPVTFCSGGSVVLSVTNAIPGYSYQWKNNGTNIANATQSSYTATTAGNYTCLVTASCGNATSNAIVVNTGGITALVSPSGSVNICSGATAALSANTGSGYNYQWKLNNVNIAGATAATYNATTAGSYTVAITSPCGNATSATTTVNIAALTATINPTNPSICAGSAQTFTANGGYNYNYQWFRNGIAQAGATNQTYANSSNGSYTVRITQGTACTVTSSISTLTVINNPTPTITPQGPTTFCNGQSVVLAANTFAGVTFQWQKNSVDIAAATNQNYTATAAGAYRVKQTANGCTKSSPAVTVTVNCREAADGLSGEGIGLSELKVMPNPFSDELTIYGLEFRAGDKLQLINMLGKVIINETITKASPSGRLVGLVNLPSGVYFLNVITSKEKKVVKVVKQ